MAWVRHRTRNRRSCDRCRLPAAWNLSRRGHRPEYACDDHADQLADGYGIPRPPRP